MGCRSREVGVKVWADLACFTRPEYAAERVSYPCMTPTAAEGLLSAICWKPQMRWIVTRISLLKPPAWASMTRNEVGVRASSRRERIEVTEHRVQRHSLMLRDVAYIVNAIVEVKEGVDAHPAKYTDQFDRRVARGAFFSPPYMGLRELPAWFGPVEADDRPIDLDLDIGPMVLDLGYSTDGSSISPRFFDAVIRSGVMEVPPVDEVAP